VELNLNSLMCLNVVHSFFYATEYGNGVFRKKLPFCYATEYGNGMFRKKLPLPLSDSSERNAMTLTAFCEINDTSFSYVFWNEPLVERSKHQQ